MSLFLETITLPGMIERYLPVPEVGPDGIRVPQSRIAKASATCLLVAKHSILCDFKRHLCRQHPPFAILPDKVS